MGGHERKEYVDAQRFAQILRQCADSIEHGVTTELTIDGETFSMAAPEEMKVEFETKKNKRELELKMVWRADEPRKH